MSETKTNQEIQIIGADIGRGYVKGYSVYNNNEKECLFKSVISDGRDGIDFSNFDDPIYIEYNGEKLFAGELAEKEGYSPISNQRDSKTTETVEQLIAILLSKVAVAKVVKLMIGVPYKIFDKKTRDEIISYYQGKVFKIEDKINGGIKEVTIEGVEIFREADAALFHALNGKPNVSKIAGLVSVGFRTTELAYYNKGFKFSDKLSTTIETGNKDVLEYVSSTILKEKGINKTLNEIDTSDDYNDLKERGYRSISEQISQEIEGKWKNLNEMGIFIAGGTALNMKFDERFKVLEDSQMATSKGLFAVAEFMTRKGKF